MDKAEITQQNQQETLEENLKRTLVILNRVQRLNDEYRSISEVNAKDERVAGGIIIRVLGLLSPVITLYLTWKHSTQDIFQKVAVLIIVLPAALIAAGLINEAGKITCRYFGKKQRDKRVKASKEKLAQIQEEYTQNITLMNTYSNVPELYRYIEAVETFLHYITTKRADTLKEVINLYEWEWRHKEKINELKEYYTSQYIIFGNTDVPEKTEDEENKVKNSCEDIGWVELLQKKSELQLVVDENNIE